MARERDPFGLALAHLRGALRDGRIPPGAPLVTSELIAALHISATPIREALSRLAGEGLVEDRRGRGVFALRYEAGELEALYGLHASYVALALDASAGFRRLGQDDVDRAPVTTDARGLRRRCEALWRAIVGDDEADLVARAHQRVADQLAAPRLVEPLVLEGVAAELETLVAAAQTLSAADFWAAAQAYHRRRQAAARALSGALRSAARAGGL